MILVDVQRFGGTLLKKWLKWVFLLQLPSVMWLLIYRPKALSSQWLTNWVSYLYFVSFQQFIASSLYFMCYNEFETIILR